MKKQLTIIALLAIMLGGTRFMESRHVGRGGGGRVGRRAGQRGAVRPGGGISGSRPSARPGRPATRPGRLGDWPSQPVQSGRPSRPNGWHGRPTTRPERPTDRPSRPGQSGRPERPGRPDKPGYDGRPGRGKFYRSYRVGPYGAGYYWGPLLIGSALYADPIIDYTSDAYLSDYDDCYYDTEGTLVCFIDGTWYNVIE